MVRKQMHGRGLLPLLLCEKAKVMLLNSLKRMHYDQIVCFISITLSIVALLPTSFNEPLNKKWLAEMIKRSWHRAQCMNRMLENCMCIDLKNLDFLILMPVSKKKFPFHFIFDASTLQSLWVCILFRWKIFFTMPKWVSRFFAQVF